MKSLTALNPHRRARLLEQLTVQTFRYSVNPERIDDQEIRLLLSLKEPQMYLYDNFLSPEECDAVISLAQLQLEDSTSICKETGDLILNPYRTSQSAFFPRQSSPVISTIEKRISRLLDYPIEKGEYIQVAYYKTQQEFKEHKDYFDPFYPGSKEHLKDGGQRFATVLMYLNDVQSGGATTFPLLGLDIQPRKGQALLFIYCDNKGVCEPRTVHAGLPVLAGEKWIATKWLRIGKAL